MSIIIPTLFDYSLSDSGIPSNTIPKQQAAQLFLFFRQHPLFNWKQIHNGCEGRADAVCLLLESWNIPTAKAWVFGGAYLKGHIGGLKNNWNYHVAAVVPVTANGQPIYYVLDPATSDAMQQLDEWADSVTDLAHSYHCIRQAHWYIFPEKKISTKKWNTRNKQNRKWMIQCIAGINSLSATGKAKLIFNKNLLKKTAAAFGKAKKEKPAFI